MEQQTKGIKIVHVHFLHGHKNYYFGSVSSIFRKFSAHALVFQLKDFRTADCADRLPPVCDGFASRKCVVASHVSPPVDVVLHVNYIAPHLRERLAKTDYCGRTELIQHRIVAMEVAALAHAISVRCDSNRRATLYSAKAESVAVRRRPSDGRYYLQTLALPVCALPAVHAYCLNHLPCRHLVVAREIR